MTDKKTGELLCATQPLNRSSWKTVKLGEVCTIKARIGWQGLKTTEYLNSGNFVLIGGTDFNNGFVNWKSCFYVSKERYDLDKNIQVEEGDILVTKDGTIGKVAFVDEIKKPSTLNSGVFLIRVNDKKILLPIYLSIVFKSLVFEDFLDKITAGSTIVHLYQKNIVDFKFPLPSILEQQHIASSLSAIDNQIVSLRRLIAKQEAIKKATLKMLLTPKAGWKTVRLGEVATIFRGGSPRPIQDYLTTNAEGVNWIKIGDATVGSKFIEHTKEKIIPEGESKSRRVFSGDFILSNSMSFGRPYILKIDGCIHDGWLAIQNYETAFKRDYLYYMLSSEFVFSQYIEGAAGSSVKNLNKEVVSSLLLPMPPVQEQKVIADTLCAIDNVLSRLQSQLEKAEQIKQGMMRHFFG